MKLRRASVILYAIFAVIIASLAYLFYQQNIDFKHYIKKSKTEIKSLKSKISDLEAQLKAKEKKIVAKNVDKNISKKKPIPKDAVVIKLPKVPKVIAKVPKIVTIGGSQIKPEKETHLSLDMPVEHKEAKKVVKDSNQTKKELKVVGLEKLGRVSTYLRATLNGNPIEKLKKAGFTILAEKKLNDSLKSIVFTDKDLEAMAAKSPFISNLRLLVDTKSKTIAIQNPIYFAKAFMQDGYDEKSAKKVLTNINKAFEGLKASKDKLKSTLLPNYQFMFGMPYYKDMITIAKAKTSDELLAKIDRSNIAFTKKLGKDSYILGVNLNPNIENFINKIGTQNANLLPYPLVIKDGEAKILDPKYYIAISYPMLKMSQFMAISSVPDEIEENIKSVIK